MVQSALDGDFARYPAGLKDPHNLPDIHIVTTVRAQDRLTFNPILTVAFS